MSSDYTSTPTGVVSFGWLGESWRLFKKEWKIWVPVSLVYWVLAGCTIAFGVALQNGGINLKFLHIPSPKTSSPSDSFIFAPDFAKYSDLRYWISSLLDYLVLAFLDASLQLMANSQVRGEKIAFRMLLSGAPLYFPFLIWDAIFGELYTFAINLYLVPVLIVQCLFIPTSAMIADRRPVTESMACGAKVFKANIWRTLQLMVVFNLIYVLGGFGTCGMGLMIITPMSFLLSSIAYRDLVGMPGMKHAREPDIVADQFTDKGVWPPAPNYPSHPES